MTIERAERRDAARRIGPAQDERDILGFKVGWAFDPKNHGVLVGISLDRMESAWTHALMHRRRQPAPWQKAGYRR